MLPIKVHTASRARLRLHDVIRRLHPKTPTHFDGVKLATGCRIRTANSVFVFNQSKGGLESSHSRRAATCSRAFTTAGPSHGDCTVTQLSESGLAPTEAGYINHARQPLFDSLLFYSSSHLGACCKYTSSAPPLLHSSTSSAFTNNCNTAGA